MVAITRLLCDGCPATNESTTVTQAAVTVRIERIGESKFDLCDKCRQKVINAAAGVGGYDALKAMLVKGEEKGESPPPFKGSNARFAV